MKQLDVYSLADDEDLTGRQIASFTFKNTTQPVKNWKEMFLKVLQILCAEDKGVITKLAASDEKGIALWFTTDSSVSHGMNPLPGLAEVYVWTNNSTQVKLSILSRLFELYDEDPSNLVFYLCESKEGDSKRRRNKRNSPRQSRDWLGLLFCVNLRLRVLRGAPAEPGPD